MKKWKIRLKRIHDESGITAYRVSKDTGVNVNTIYRYLSQDEIVQDVLPAHVVTLVEYYGRDWHDPSIIEYGDDKDEESEPSITAA